MHRNGKLMFFYLLLLPVLLGLGVWQLQRADYKQQLQTQYDQRVDQRPMPLAEADFKADLAYQPVQVHGEFDNEHLFLLDNQIVRGRAGFDVLSPFLLEKPLTLAPGEPFELVLVNRGWVPINETREDLPEVSPVVAPVRLQGLLIKPAQGLVLAEVPLSGQWPELIQKVELDVMADRLATEGQKKPRILPYVLELAAGEPGSFHVDSTPLDTGARRSVGYAVQWFLMAAVLTGLYLWAVFKRE